ncbi:MAG: MarR family transcriptional regulator [Acidimicrobiia bacterium]|nr:MarR family transcriptional regulator [Acidimicrobiia bacterium]
MAAHIDDDRITLVGLVLETLSGLRDEFERTLQEESGIGGQWFEVLIRLARSPGHRLRMSELALQTTLTPSGLTRVVDRLEEAGLVARASCPSDRRGYFAVLTEEGVRTVRDALPGHLAVIDANLTGVISSREREQFERILRKLRDHVKPGAAARKEPGG